MAKINLAFKFLSWTKLLKNYYNADKKDGDERESCWQACTKSSSLGPYMRKEPNYRTEILVEFAKTPRFSSVYRKQNFRKKVGTQAKFKVQRTWAFCTACATSTQFEPTWGNKLLKKGQKSWRTDEFSSVFKILLQKNIEESSYHNRNFDCDITKSPRSTCANFRQFGVLHAEKRPIS